MSLKNQRAKGQGGVSLSNRNYHVGNWRVIRPEHFGPNDSPRFHDQAVSATPGVSVSDYVRFESIVILERCTQGAVANANRHRLSRWEVLTIGLRRVKTMAIWHIAYPYKMVSMYAKQQAPDSEEMVLISYFPTCNFPTDVAIVWSVGFDSSGIRVTSDSLANGISRAECCFGSFRQVFSETFWRIGMLYHLPFSELVEECVAFRLVLTVGLKLSCVFAPNCSSGDASSSDSSRSLLRRKCSACLGVS